jgi:hypothetical protein
METFVTLARETAFDAAPDYQAFDTCLTQLAKLGGNSNKKVKLTQDFAEETKENDIDKILTYREFQSETIKTLEKQNIKGIDRRAMVSRMWKEYKAVNLDKKKKIDKKKTVKKQPEKKISEEKIEQPEKTPSNF